MNNLSIYQDRILKLAAENKKSTIIDVYNRQFEMRNPMCGDEVKVRINLINNKINNISASVRGCALCEASGGLVVHLFKENKIPYDNFMDDFSTWLKNLDQDIKLPFPKEMELFNPIREINNRHGCITMPFEAAIKSLKTPLK